MQSLNHSKRYSLPISFSVFPMLRQSKSIYAADILQIAALAASQASLTFLVIAINPTRKLLLSCYAILGYLVAWTIASIIAVSFKCSLPGPWNTNGNKCVDLFALNVGIYTLNILGDISIVVVPFIMMQKVQVSSSKRFVVSGLFACRLAYVQDNSLTVCEQS